MKTRKGLKSILVVLLVGLVLLLVVPFLVPVPAIEDLRSPESLADADSQFVEINGVGVHLKTMGEGEPVFVLLHGFGASLYSWQAVMEPLSQLGGVIAYDRTGFGLTERPVTWQGQNPYGPEAQVDLLLGLLDHYGVEQAILIGNSAGGTVAMQFTLAYPERVQALVLVDPAVYINGGAPTWVKPLLATPQMRHLGPLIARQILSRGDELIRRAWHDPALISAETLENYKKPTRVEGWDKALWEITLASRPNGLPERLSELSLPVLVITGDDDRIVPTADSLRLADELPNARIVVVPEAGHVPHEEKPEDFMEAVNGFMAEIQP